MSNHIRSGEIHRIGLGVRGSLLLNCLLLGLVAKAKELISTLRFFS